MKKKQFITIFIAICIVILIYFLPTSKKLSNNVNSNIITKKGLQDIELKEKEFAAIPKSELLEVKQLDSMATISKNNIQKISIYNKLAKLSLDKLHSNLLYYFYSFNAAILYENEKDIKPIAQEFIDNVLFLDENELQFWFIEKSTILQSKLLQLNPNNDSTKINIALCELFSGGGNPMNSIAKIKEIEKNNPQNTYSNYILALASKKSGQFKKAIERFVVILQADKKNVEVLLQLAECYEKINDKEKAIETYIQLKKYIKFENAKIQIDKRILELKK